MLKFHSYKLYSQSRIILFLDDFTIPPGSFYYILGACSAGKSLFLSSIGGEYTNYKGVITLKNQKLSPGLKHNNILMINNDLPIIDKMTVLENIEIPIGKISPIAKKRLLEMAAIVDIIDFLNVKMQICSRSEKMLMYLVRAALVNPYVLLIDDLDTFFDNNMYSSVHELFAYFQKSGMIIIGTGKGVLDNVITYTIKHAEVVRII